MPDPDLVLAHPPSARRLHDLPSYLRADPDVQGVIYAQAKEGERLEARVEEVRDQFFPQTITVAMSLWEFQLGLSVNPVGLDIDERRARIVARIAALGSGSKGTDWQDAITDGIGPGWVYEEHIPGDVTSPDPYVIRITLPWAANSLTFKIAQRFIEDVSPANLDFEWLSSDVFTLDQSLLDGDEGLA